MDANTVVVEQVPLKEEEIMEDRLKGQQRNDLYGMQRQQEQEWEAGTSGLVDDGVFRSGYCLLRPKYTAAEGLCT